MVCESRRLWCSFYIPSKSTEFRISFQLFWGLLYRTLPSTCLYTAKRWIMESYSGKFRPSTSTLFCWWYSFHNITLHTLLCRNLFLWSLRDLYMLQNWTLIWPVKLMMRFDYQIWSRNLTLSESWLSGARVTVAYLEGRKDICYGRTIFSNKTSPKYFICL